MILIVGGMAQGKKKFAEDMFAGAEAVRWADGASAALEDFAQAPFGCHFTFLSAGLWRGILRFVPGKCGFPWRRRRNLRRH